ncbi:DUF485 domain-containing protein [Agromyces sp. NDB4Y10]|uniref:DUF485 domain-containing protein n=1 Tax=Agromyces sp. NDB4Y10 TaxID=1775951 RepID=UPI000B0161C7|nr:DUF485 domain-containing protein [Agromyces sp. NDB4Y10]
MTDDEAPPGGRGGREAPVSRPARVRVTAPRTGAPAASARPSIARTRPGGSGDVDAMYVRSLIRSQLRLALICAGGFVAATAVFVIGIALLPALDETFVAGVPVSWLLLGLGVYPLAISVAALYVRAAQRNEARYRSLAEQA